MNMVRFDIFQRKEWVIKKSYNLFKMNNLKILAKVLMYRNFGMVTASRATVYL